MPLTDNPRDIRIEDLDSKTAARLVKLYADTGIATDGLPYSPELTEIVQNLQTPELTEPRVYHLLISMRKNGYLPKVSR